MALFNHFSYILIYSIYVLVRDEINRIRIVRRVKLKIISIRENPEYKNKAIEYFQNKWASKETRIIYEDCISHSISTPSPLPQWYLLLNDELEEIIGCAGLITNDFISRIDLYPWLCALYIEKEHRGNAYGSLLLTKAKEDTKKAGFNCLYLCTEHIGYYEKYNFTYIGQGYHPWGESSRIYESVVRE